jgi:hypothetical protein
VNRMAAPLRQAGNGLAHLPIADDRDTHWDRWTLSTKARRTRSPGTAPTK